MINDTRYLDCVENNNDICISEYDLDKPILKSILQLSTNQLFFKVLGIKMVQAASLLLPFLRENGLVYEVRGVLTD